MSSIEVDTDDIQRIRAQIRYDIEVVNEETQRILTEAREEAKMLAQEEVPIGKTAGPGKYPGQLWDAIRESRTVDEDEVGVEVDELIAPYARHVIWGTQVSEGRYVPGIGRVPGGEHPGTPANPFMGRAADRLSHRLGNIIRRIVRRIRL